jgi:hypothetical protein
MKVNRLLEYSFQRLELPSRSNPSPEGRRAKREFIFYLLINPLILIDNF